MKTINLFYQGEGLTEIQHLEVGPDSLFGALRAQLVEKHGLAGDALLFVEDDEDPIDEAIKVSDRAGPKGLKLHLNRCRHVTVKVTFNAKTVEQRFAPGATVARVKRWAAEREFGMTEEEAGEHVLQITGTHERPAPSTHIGVLAERRICAVSFDLVADERVNGSTEAGSDCTRSARF